MVEVQMSVDKKWNEYLSEMFSTRGIKPGTRIETSGEDHYEGTKERAQHQGLKNLGEMENLIHTVGNPEDSNLDVPKGRHVVEKKSKKKKVKVKKRTKKSYCESTPCDEMGFSQKASCKSQGFKDCYAKNEAESYHWNEPKWFYGGGYGDGKVHKIISEELSALELEKLIGVSGMEYLASGKFGNVYKANHPELGEVAVKLLSAETGKVKGSANIDQIRKEIDNYENIGIAVDANDQVAKHFPKIYDVGMKRTEDGVLGYIVMELIKPSPYSQEVVNSLFAGLEYYLQQDEMGFNEPLALKDEPELQDREVSIDRRAENVFLHGKGQIEDMVAELYQGLMTELDWSSMNPEQIKLAQGFRDAAMGVFYNYFVNIDGISERAMTSRYNTAKNNILKLFPTAKRVLESVENVINSDYKDRMIPKLGVMAVIASIIETISRLPHREDMASEVIMMIEDAVRYPRGFTVIPTGYYSSTIDNIVTGKRQDMPEAAKSLEKAFVALRNEVGLVPRDLHSLNVMVKDNTGEVVIIDFGNFNKVI